MKIMIGPIFAALGTDNTNTQGDAVRGIVPRAKAVLDAGGNSLPVGEVLPKL